MLKSVIWVVGVLVVVSLSGLHAQDLPSGGVGSFGGFGTGPTVTATARSRWVTGGALEGPSDRIDLFEQSVSLGFATPLWRGARLSLRGSFEHRRYDFKGDNRFFAGTTEPWKDVPTVGLQGSLFVGLSRDWGVILLGGARASAEAGADLLDGVSYNALIGAGFKVSDNLRLGVGVLGLFGLEDSFRAFPGLQLDWQISDDWRFRILGPGADLSWEPAEDWNLTLSARLAGRRFRTEDDAVTGASVVQDQRLPVSLRVQHQATESLGIDLEVGVDVIRKFRIENRRGQNRRTFDADPGLFISAGFTFTF